MTKETKPRSVPGPTRQEGSQPMQSLPELTYEPYPEDVDIGIGDPHEVFTQITRWFVDQRVFKVRGETVIGKLRTLVGEEMDLTADTILRAVRIFEMDEENHTTGNIVYVLYRELPEHFQNAADYPIEYIQEDWPAGIVFPEHSLYGALQTPGIRTLAVSVQDNWRAHGGNPDYKLDKSGGRGFKD